MRFTGYRVSSRHATICGLGFGLIVALTWPALTTARGRGLDDEQKPKASGEKAAPKETVSPSPTSASAPATIKVEKAAVKTEVTMSGVFESAKSTEVSIRPKAWALPLVVDHAIDLGTPVKKGDILVELEHEKIDKMIKDTEVENALAELALKQAAEELPILDKSLPVDIAAAERAKTQADDDLKIFLEIDRPNSERTARFMVKQAIEYLEYSKEELRQLEKMYRSKDLTEETEEIILRRQRFQVESSEFYKKEAELRRDQTLKIELPRQEERVRETAVKLGIDLAKARALLPLNLNQKRLAFEKLKHDHSKESKSSPTCAPIARR